MRPPECTFHPTAPHLARQIYTLFPFRHFAVESFDGNPVPASCIAAQYAKYRAFIDGFLAYAARTNELSKLGCIEDVPDYESVLANLARTLEDGIRDAVRLMPMIVVRRKRRTRGEREEWKRQYLELTEAEEETGDGARAGRMPEGIWQFR